VGKDGREIREQDPGRVLYTEAGIVSRNRTLPSASCILEGSVTFGLESIIGFGHEEAIVKF